MLWLLVVLSLMYAYSNRARVLHSIVSLEQLFNLLSPGGICFFTYVSRCMHKTFTPFSVFALEGLCLLYFIIIIKSELMKVSDYNHSLESLQRDQRKEMRVSRIGLTAQVLIRATRYGIVPCYLLPHCKL